MKRKIYAASSWRNPHYYEVVFAIANAGHEVYNFRRRRGFHWHEIDKEWERWTPTVYKWHLFHSSVIRNGFNVDLNGMQWADTCVLILPCGKSAHLEAGWFIGQNKPVFVYLHPDGFEPELMYRLIGSENALATTLDELVSILEKAE